MWLSWGQKSQIKYFLWQSACLPRCICDRCKHAILLLRKRGQSSDITLQLRVWVRGWEGQRTACPALGQPGDTIINVPTALPRLLGLLPVNKSWVSCKQICHSGKWNVPQDPQKQLCWQGHRGDKSQPWWGLSEATFEGKPAKGFQKQPQKELFPVFAVSRGRRAAEMLSIHYCGFAGVATGDTQEHPQPGGHRAALRAEGNRKQSCRRSSAHVCAVEGCPAPAVCGTILGVSPAQPQGDAEQGVATHHLSCQNSGGRDNYKCWRCQLELQIDCLLWLGEAPLLTNAWGAVWASAENSSSLLRLMFHSWWNLFMYYFPSRHLE